jgi:ketosteroid isomerase-like protein
VTSADVVRSFFATLSAGDLDALRTFFDGGSTWEICATGIPGAGEHLGAEAIVDGFLRPVRGMFQPGEPKIEIRELVTHDDLVAVEAVGRGRFLDGRVYENRYAYWIEVDGGKIRTIREYMDSAYVASLAL